MPLSLLYKKEPGRIGNLTLDARLEENHIRDNEVTQYPVEEGFDITDNVRKRPLSYTMTGMVTNAPIDIETLITDFSENRVTNAYDELLFLYNFHDLVSIQTTLQLYTDMVMESLQVPRNSTIGDELRFTATFKQIVKARTEFSQITVKDVNDIGGNSPEIDKRGVDKSNVGTQNTKGASLLFKLLN